MARRQQRQERQRQVAAAVQFLLDASGATRKQLAEFFGKDPSTITDRLKPVDPTSISVDDADLFAEFFDIEIHVLWMSEDELYEWATPERRRALRQRVAVVDLRDSPDVGTTPYPCNQHSRSGDLILVGR